MSKSTAQPKGLKQQKLTDFFRSPQKTTNIVLPEQSKPEPPPQPENPVSFFSSLYFTHHHEFL